jgi:adenylosuccinate synthase
MKDNLAIIGMQWGDEGKGKIVDLLSPRFKIVARFQGGNNAGHTVKFGGNTFVLHMVPSGIFHNDIINIIGNGVAVNPDALIEEMDALKALGVSFENRLFISERAHLIMPYHLSRDKSSEDALGKKKIGTTSKGIGPTYGDKALRRGIRACMLVSNSYVDLMRDLLEANLERNELLYQNQPMNINDLLARFDSWRKILGPYIADTSLLLYNSIQSGKRALFEGAQGTMLDIDYGTYPYVTSSNSSAAGIASGLGIGPSMAGKILGITKAYCTRVGGGPFPSELTNSEGEILRERGKEYGATTGRPRR